MKNKYCNGPDKPSLVAAIDLGSNSFHMIIARVEQHEIRPLDCLGRKVQIAAGIGTDNNISSEAMQRGLNCLSEFAQYLSGKIFQSIRIVGTSALRKAKNSLIFIEKANEILPYPIEIISGREEARLIYLGVSQTQADDDAQRLVVDIGGGSTEFIIGKKFDPKLLESLHMGCVTFTERYFGNGKITPERFQSAYYAARLELLNISKEYCNLGWTDAIGSSGSIKAVSRILKSLTGSDIITLRGLELIKNKLLHFHDLKSLQMPELKADRQTILPSGLAILLASFDALNIEQMSFSEGALREGVLYDLLGRDQHEDVRERTINALINRYHVDAIESENTRKHAQLCFDQTHSAWELTSSDDLPLLIWAARVTRIGLDISHSQFHNHSAYLITHSDLMGFNKEQQKEIAFLVENHRCSISQAGLAALLQHRKSSLLRILILLRISCILNHSIIKTTKEAYCLKVKGSNISVSFQKNWLNEHPLTRAEFEQETIYLAKVNFSLKVV